MKEKELHNWMHYRATCYIAIFLIMEKHKGVDSIFKPWLDLLPNTYLDSPLYFSKEENNLLNGSHFQARIDDEFAAIKYDYSVVAYDVPGFEEEIPFEEYLEMYVLLWSRMFSMEIAGVGETTGMAPFADMPNHDN